MTASENDEERFSCLFGDGTEKGKEKRNLGVNCLLTMNNFFALVVVDWNDDGETILAGTILLLCRTQ